MTGMTGATLVEVPVTVYELPGVTQQEAESAIDRVHGYNDFMEKNLNGEFAASDGGKLPNPTLVIALQGVVTPSSKPLVVIVRPQGCMNSACEASYSPTSGESGEDVARRLVGALGSKFKEMEFTSTKFCAGWLLIGIPKSSAGMTKLEVVIKEENPTFKVHWLGDFAFGATFDEIQAIVSGHMARRKSNMNPIQVILLKGNIDWSGDMAEARATHIHNSDVSDSFVDNVYIPAAVAIGKEQPLLLLHEIGHSLTTSGGHPEQSPNLMAMAGPECEQVILGGSDACPTLTKKQKKCIIDGKGDCKGNPYHRARESLGEALGQRITLERPTDRKCGESADGVVVIEWLDGDVEVHRSGMQHSRATPRMAQGDHPPGSKRGNTGSRAGHRTTKGMSDGFGSASRRRDYLARAWPSMSSQVRRQQLEGAFCVASMKWYLSGKVKFRSDEADLEWVMRIVVEDEDFLEEKENDCRHSTWQRSFAAAFTSPLDTK